MTTPLSIDLREYESARAIRLTAAQRDILLRHPLTVRPTPGETDCYDITPSSEIGSIELPGLSIRIHPKLPIDRVMFLISYATGVFSLSEEPSDFDPKPELFEAIIAGFIAQIRRALRPGLLQGYRMEEEALATVRGRLRFEILASRRLGMTPPIDVRYDDYTVDIDENRVIKAALARLRRMRLRSEDSRRALRQVGGVLANVSEVEFGNQLPRFLFNRLNDRYRPAILMAQLILRATSYDLRRGEASSRAFLIDMNRVFEEFVVQALRDELRLSDKQFPQGAVGRRLLLDVAGRIQLKPDISWWDGKNCVFVGDVKYKKTTDMRVPNADLYQLLAYTTATNLPGGLLIYAAGEEEPGTNVVRYAGKRLDVVAFDLAGSPKQVLDGIRSVAQRIRQMRAVPHAEP